MSKKEYVSYGSCAVGVPGSKEGIAGIRFNLAPMSDNFVDIILSSLENVDTSMVWSETDPTSTVYRGRESAVFDGVRAVFSQAYHDDVHMSLHMTISKGCPGDHDADYTLDYDDKRINDRTSRKISFPVVGKFSLYPMGTDNYMSLIEEVVNNGIDRGVYAGSGHYTTYLKGDVHDVFDYLEYVAERTGKDVSHYIIEASLLCNLPEGESL